MKGKTTFSDLIKRHKEGTLLIRKMDGKHGTWTWFETPSESKQQENAAKPEGYVRGDNSDG